MHPAAVPRPASRPLGGTFGTRTGGGVCRVSWGFPHGLRLLRATTGIDTRRIQPLRTCNRGVAVPFWVCPRTRHAGAGTTGTSRPSARTTSLGAGRRSSMLGGHARTTETAAPFTPVDLPGQRAPWLQRRPAWSAGPESPLLAGGDSPVLGSASLGRSTAGGALRVRHGVVSRPVKRWPAAADDVLDCAPPGSRRAATDKLAELRAAAYLYHA